MRSSFEAINLVVCGELTGPVLQKLFTNDAWSHLSIVQLSKEQGIVERHPLPHLGQSAIPVYLQLVVTEYVALTAMGAFQHAFWRQLRDHDLCHRIISPKELRQKVSSATTFSIPSQRELVTALCLKRMAPKKIEP
jgi:hypothetical protein